MRDRYDFYPTPEWATNELLHHIPIGGWILEPCAGQLDIAKPLERAGPVITNDLALSSPSMFHQDILGDWNFGREAFDWVITNPPFSLAPKIIPLAYQRAVEGIAMFLRLSYLEPVENRGSWLNKHPPTTLLVLPRMSFRNNGKTDSVTCAWMVWNKIEPQQQIIIAENPKFAKMKEQDALIFA